MVDVDVEGARVSRRGFAISKTINALLLFVLHITCYFAAYSNRLLSPCALLANGRAGKAPLRRCLRVLRARSGSHTRLGLNEGGA